MYQVKKTVFDHIYKHRGSSREYDVQRQTLFLLFSMLSVSRTCFNEFLSLLDVAWVNKVLLLLLLLLLGLIYILNLELRGKRRNKIVKISN